MSGLDPDPGSESTAASVPPPGVVPPSAPAGTRYPEPIPPSFVPSMQAGADSGRGAEAEPLTASQADAIAKVAAMAAARPPAAEQGLSRAVTFALVALGVLVAAMLLLALLVA